MSSTQLSVGMERAARADRMAWRRGGLQGSEQAWAVAFLLPYAAVFVGFVFYPVAYGIWLGSKPQLYADLFADPRYWATVVNTLLLVGVGVNVKMFLALLLSGFFVRRGRWVKALLALYMLPWALPVLPAYLSLHWMLIGQGGFLNSVLELFFDIDGPIWFNSYPLALGANILAVIWKWMPFWTLVFLAGRLAIPQDVYEAAAVDGATGLRRFTFVTLPLLGNLYLLCTLLSVLWTVGDFNSAAFVSGGAPALSTEVLATYAFRIAFGHGYPELGLTAVMATLPVLVPVAILLMRRIQATELQL